MERGPPELEMSLPFIRRVIGTVALMHILSLGVFAAEQDPGQDVLMRALSDELDRSMTLKLEDLEEPYFIQYSVADRSKSKKGNSHRNAPRSYLHRQIFDRSRSSFSQRHGRDISSSGGPRSTTT